MWTDTAPTYLTVEKLPIMRFGFGPTKPYLRCFLCLCFRFLEFFKHLVNMYKILQMLDMYSHNSDCIEQDLLKVSQLASIRLLFCFANSNVSLPRSTKRWHPIVGHLPQVKMDLCNHNLSGVYCCRYCCCHCHCHNLWAPLLSTVLETETLNFKNK